ncbi:hypothetical protein BDV98DRAFT_583176 [Pterulicium gracile]|uniref:Uncharacterized protein n=1 Tax=Pterulicium gracile TaxID=1884261 RepID=A0A5C3QLT2_9AGAR|nr:hypothetical protein BDV98DRAFT_583176 [Pterula gracilis]
MIIPYRGAQSSEAAELKGNWRVGVGLSEGSGSGTCMCVSMTRHPKMMLLDDAKDGAALDSWYGYCNRTLEKIRKARLTCARTGSGRFAAAWFGCRAFAATCGYKPSERNDGKVDVFDYSISRSTSYLVPTRGILSVLESSYITTEDLRGGEGAKWLERRDADGVISAKSRSRLCKDRNFAVSRLFAATATNLRPCFLLVLDEASLVLVLAVREMRRNDSFDARNCLEAHGARRGVQAGSRTVQLSRDCEWTNSSSSAAARIYLHGSNVSHTPKIAEVQRLNNVLGNAYRTLKESIGGAVHHLITWIHCLNTTQELQVQDSGSALDKLFRGYVAAFAAK